MIYGLFIDYYINFCLLKASIMRNTVCANRSTADRDRLHFHLVVNKIQRGTESLFSVSLVRHLVRLLRCAARVCSFDHKHTHIHNELISTQPTPWRLQNVETERICEPGISSAKPTSWVSLIVISDWEVWQCCSQTSGWGGVTEIFVWTRREREKFIVWQQRTWRAHSSSMSRAYELRGYGQVRELTTSSWSLC